MRKSGHLFKWLYYWTITLSLSTLVMNRCAESHFFYIVLAHAACRCGALPGRRKARMRASSQILTARPGSESSAPYPTHATSQSTSAARQALPWTQRTSATCGDASFLRHCLRREGDGRKTVQDPDQRRHGQERGHETLTTPAALPRATWCPAESLLRRAQSSLPLLSYCVLLKSFAQLLKFKVAANAFLNTGNELFFFNVGNHSCILLHC